MHKQKYISFTIFFMIIMLLACSSSSGPDYVMPVKLSTVFEPSSLVTNVSYIVLTITAGDEVLYVDTLEMAGGTVQTSASVSPGFDRYIVLNAYDADDNLLYSGNTTIDVGLGDVVDVTIDMIPQVFMLKIDPLYQEIDRDAYFDVYVYNAVDLFGITFKIRYDSEIINYTNTEIAQPGIGDFLGLTTLSYVRAEGDSISVSITRKRGEDGISGSGHLARFHFTPGNLGTSDLDLVMEEQSWSKVIQGEPTLMIEPVDYIEDGQITILPQEIP